MPYGAIRSETGSLNSNYMFTDQERDVETGLYNYGARLYDPIMGVFSSSDIVVPSFADPQSLNRYNYCRNNPLAYVDPTGHNPILIGMAIGAFMAGAQSDWNPEAMFVGAVVGGISAGVFSGVDSAVWGAMNTSLQSGTISLGAVNALCYGTAGAVSGAVEGGVNAAYYGGDIGQGTLTGAGYGVLNGMLKSSSIGSSSPFGQGALGSIGNRVFNTALAGSLLGGSYAAITGGDIGKGALNGAKNWAVGEGVNMIVGHSVGFIGSGFEKPKFENGAFFYDTPFDGWITFSNVVSGPYGHLDESYQINGRTYTWRAHELGHLPQGTLLGPAYIPAQAASLTVGSIIGVFTGHGVTVGSHRFILLERTFHSAPSY
jgi:RHS repeat-associated protein